MTPTRKTILVTALLSLPMFANAAGAQSDLYGTVTNLWWSGPKTGVLSIARERLSEDTNDIAGIVLQLEYDFSLGTLPAISNSIGRYVIAGRGIATPSFKLAYPIEAYGLCMAFESVSGISEEAWESERAKGLLTHKRMDMSASWAALRDDGWLGTEAPANVPDNDAIAAMAPGRGSPMLRLGKMLAVQSCIDSAMACGQYATVTNLLQAADANGILAYAAERRNDDPDDLLCSELEFLVHFLGMELTPRPQLSARLAALSSAVERIRLAGASETRQPFAGHWPWISAYLDNIEIWLSGPDAAAFAGGLFPDNN